MASIRGRASINLTLQLASPEIWQRRIRLEQHDGVDYVAWNYAWAGSASTGDYNWHSPVDTSTCLEEFLALACDGDNAVEPRDVLAFVKRYGALRANVTPRKDDDEIEFHTEPISTYEEYARRMSGILTIDAMIKKGIKPSEADWAALHPARCGIIDQGANAVHYRALLAYHCTVLLRQATLLPSLDWDSDDKIMLGLRPFRRSRAEYTGSRRISASLPFSIGADGRHLVDATT